MAEIKRRPRSLPELSSPPPWFEFSFLLDFAEGADMVRGSTVAPLGPSCLSVRGSNSCEEFPPKVPPSSFTWTACCSSVCPAESSSGSGSGHSAGSHACFSPRRRLWPFAVLHCPHVAGVQHLTQSLAGFQNLTELLSFIFSCFQYLNFRIAKTIIFNIFLSNLSY